MRVPGQRPAWQRLLRRHRRAVAAALAGLAVLLALTSLRPAPPATTPVLVATRSAGAGTLLTPGDVATVPWPADLVPPNALTDLANLPDRPLAAPVAAGEALVPERFLAPSILAAYGAGLVATPVRLADRGAAALLRAGDVVDVLAASPGEAGETTSARTVATAVRVLLAGSPTADAGPLAPAGTEDGSLVVLATSTDAAAAIAGAAATSRLSVVLRSA